MWSKQNDSPLGCQRQGGMAGAIPPWLIFCDSNIKRFVQVVSFPVKLAWFFNNSGCYLRCDDDCDVAEQGHQQVITHAMRQAGQGGAWEPAAGKKSHTANNRW